MPLDVTPALAPERALLLELLRGLAPDEWELSTECPAWDVKGLALHILGDDLSLLSRQRDAATQGLIIFAEHHPGLTFRALLDGFNEQWVAAGQFLSVPMVLEMLRLVGEWSDDFYCNVGLDTISGEPVGFYAQTEPSPYWQVIAREYAERVIHQSQIRRAVGRPELDGEPVTWMARAVSHALALWLRDYDAADGATIAMDWGAPGTWTWQRQPSGWIVHEDTANAPTATVTVAPGRAVALLTRGIAPGDVDTILAFSGDAALARGAMSIVAPLMNP